MYIQVLCPFINWVVLLFLLLSFMNFVCILYTNNLLNIWLANIFSHSVGQLSFKKEDLLVITGQQNYLILVSMAVVTNYHKLSGLNNRSMFSHRAGCQKPEITVTSLKSRCWQSHTPSRGFGEGAVPCLFQFQWLLAFLSLPPWWHYPNLFHLLSNIPLPLIRTLVVALRAHPDNSG